MSECVHASINIDGDEGKMERLRGREKLHLMSSKTTHLIHPTCIQRNSSAGNCSPAPTTIRGNLNTQAVHHADKMSIRQQHQTVQQSCSFCSKFSRNYNDTDRCNTRPLTITYCTVKCHACSHGNGAVHV